MHLPLFAAAATALFSSTAHAVFADEAWNVDYHYALVGEPKESTTFFHQPNPNSRASLIYTLSEEGVLGAVNPKDGILVWRQPLPGREEGEGNYFLRPVQGQETVVSGAGHDIAAWSSADGKLAWTYKAAGLVQDVEILELSDGKEEQGRAKDAIVLSDTGSALVQRVDGSTGAITWHTTLDAGDIPYQVSTSDTQVFAILLHKTMLGYYKIKVVTLDPVDGKKIDEITLSSDNELSSTDTIISVGANSASPVVAWTDASRTVLRVNILGTKSIASFNIDQSSGSVKEVHLHAPYYTNSLAHFLVHYQTSTEHWAEVYHIDLSKNTIKKAYELTKAPGHGTFSTSVSEANVFFSRLTLTSITTHSSASERPIGQFPVQGFSTGSDTEDSAPVHAVSEVSIKEGAVSAIRTALYLSSGDWVLLRNGNPVWQRPEVLASTTTAIFATPKKAELLVHELELEAHSSLVGGYIHRIKRHIEDWEKLPEYLGRLPERITRNLFGTSADKVGRDIFGFHKIIVCATKTGRVVAIDAGAPDKILWSRRLSHIDIVEGLALKLTAPAGDVVNVQAGSGFKASFNATTGQTLPFVSGNELPELSPNDVKFVLKNGKLEASGNSGPVWHFVPAQNERIVDLVSRPVNEPVASIGKVLGDRRVLYKYLNPNLALLTTANDAKQTASCYVLDTVSGSVLWSSTHNGVDLASPITAILSENWFAYSYTSESSGTSPKGHQLVSGEIYESLDANDRGPLTGNQTYSSLQTESQPFTLVHSYQIPEPIAKLTVTQTGQGITSRQLLGVLTDSNSIVGIPQGIIDPRRPVGRDPDKNELAEGLGKYEPVLEFSPKWFLNHQREVIGVKDVITSPALLESTSLVFAYGLDVFGTRLSPSFNFDMLGKDFNKFQMMATVAALFVATLVVAPLVQRKQINTRWQFA
ncbi:DUF1620-domain-containing protein [Polychaeton citri CBS 116435]|uniref:ER membrane protein complex subunit 1 n=1 Tax=Polychaeton citri CBS 116435 TaxID=1314669 RepID=A0A9P4QF63_9PEZI|nr:DUF1620-domain-containing protein [Polychaeton citri CBS 116435]